MGRFQKATLAILTTLAVAALAAVILTWNWANYRERLRTMRAGQRLSGNLVDTRALDTAEQLSQLAETRMEQRYAQEALRLADYSVDAAFAAALRDAETHPAPLTPQTRELGARVTAAAAEVAADQERIAQLKRQIGKAGTDRTDGLQQELELTQAQLELDQDELQDAHQDLSRAGGDKGDSIKRLRDQHEASQHAAQAPTSSAGATPATGTPSIELTKSRSVLAQAQAWWSLDAKQKQLRLAEQSTLERKTKLVGEHASLEKDLNLEKSQTPVHAKPKSATLAATSPSSLALSFLKDLESEQKNLSQLGKRIDNEQELAALYGNWIDYLRARKQAFVHGLLVSTLWILLIALFASVSNEAIRRAFSDLSAERRIHTLRTALRFGIQGLGIVLILLVVFGMPSNFATVLALAGAGLTVALKDFIVGFFGWFVLMGKDGMRPGDWVEINGVAGEVLEVGLFHTVLLETGSWSDAAHPTGRKVTFVNSFAIEGHYFNFSTSGQWLWDELQVEAPQGTDPYPLADSIRDFIGAETATNAQLAEREWERVLPAQLKRTFSAAPSVSVRPTGRSVSIGIRYLTRARERQETRTRFYRAVIELLQKRDPHAVASDAAPAEEHIPAGSGSAPDS